MTEPGAPRSTVTPATSDFHPAANLFPLITRPPWRNSRPISQPNGLQAIWRHNDGRIVDGRNRWWACQLARIECRHRTYEKGDDTIRTPRVVSKNLHRRHLTTAQRAAIAAESNLGHGQRADRVDTAIAVSQPKPPS